ncbi:MAG: Mu-like prophage major head subunit gpT family protein [candidate division WOR-3 bacterium]
MSKKLIDLYKETVLIKSAGGVDQFANLLGEQMHKELIDNFRKIPDTWKYFARASTVSDFKPHHRIILSEAEPLLPRHEHEPVKDSRLTEARYSVNVVEYSRAFSVTREMIVNDDIDAIKQIPKRLGRAAARAVNEVLHALLNNGGSINSYDGVPFFHSSHNNTSTTSLTPDLAGANAIIAGITAIKEQRDLSGRHVLGLTPKYLVVPPALFSTAKILCESEYLVSGGVAVYNPAYGLLEPVEDIYITSNTAWYITCDPNDVWPMEVAFLDGYEEPKLLRQAAGAVDVIGGQESPYDFTFSELKYKVEYIFGVAFAEHKAIYRGNS